MTRRAPFSSSLHLDLGALLAGGLHADVALRCGEAAVDAHAVLLRARSPVFAALLARAGEKQGAGAVSSLEASKIVLTMPDSVKPAISACPPRARLFTAQVFTARL